jgi:putative ABC transport system substrate-binding protein
MRRRDFIAAIAGSAATWPLTARAQQGERMRRIGMLMPWADNPQVRIRIGMFLQALKELNWTDGRNVQIDYCWSGSHADQAQKCGLELAALGPDVILAPGSSGLGPALQATRTVPIVFVHVPDPVGSGFVQSLARPGGNATGFMSIEPSIVPKWAELLKEIAPSVTQVAVLRDPATRGGISQWSAIEAVAPLLRVRAIPVNVRDADEIRRALADLARSPKGALIVTGGPFATTYSKLIIALAAQYKMPAIYYTRSFVAGGGLISYGADSTLQYRQAASYVDRILRGEKPADLPVQAPTKYELVLNLKTAKELGIRIPDSVLARADAVIE